MFKNFKTKHLSALYLKNFIGNMKIVRLIITFIVPKTYLCWGIRKDNGLIFNN